MEDNKRAGQGRSKSSGKDQNSMQPPRAGQEPSSTRPEEEEEETGGRLEEDEEGSEIRQSPGSAPESGDKMP